MYVYIYAHMYTYMYIYIHIYSQEKTLEIPLESKKIKPANFKGNQP